MPEAKPAQVEDYDSEEGAVKAGTRRQATGSVTSTAVPSQPERARRRDSAYVPRNGVGTSSNLPAQVSSASTSAREAAAPRGRPAQNSDSQRASQKAPVRVASSSRQAKGCNDPNCVDVNCATYRARYAAWVAEYQRQQAQKAAAAQVIPKLNAPLQLRNVSTSRPVRPVSIHGYSMPSVPTTSYRGPPPSPSAYQNYYTPQYAHYAQQPQPQAYLGTTPPNQILPSFLPRSPITAAPPSPQYPLQRTYSARQISTGLSSFEYPKATTKPGLSRTLSARKPAKRAVPGSYPNPESAESESESESDISEGEIDRQRRYWKDRAKTIKRSSTVSPRRPSLDSRYSAPTTYAPSRNDPPRGHARRLDQDYPSSSEYVDSDRTRRADGGRRSGSAYSSRSRRPSVSTTTSSGRTRATTNTSFSGSGSGRGRVIVEDRHGRHTAYLSEEAQTELLRRYQQQKEDIEAYQAAVEGISRVELTAENISKMDRRRSGSHIGSMHSRRTSRSVPRTVKSEGIKIQSGDTVLHVYGDAKIEMRPGEDGGPATFVVGSSSGKDSAYHSGSNRSGSRKARSRLSSDVGGRRETIHEESGGS